MDSILTSIKKLLGISEEYTHFDSDLIMHINSAFMILTQIGVGPEEGFAIVDSSSTWDEFIPSDSKRLQAVKTYIHMKVKLVFDPPSGSAVLEVTKQLISELEWRLNHEAEFVMDKEEGGNQNGSKSTLPLWY